MKLLLALLIMFLAAPALADENFRCGKWIASRSMSPAELLEKCGEPTQRESSTQDVMARNRNTGLVTKVGESQIEVWTYDRGPTAPPMVVTIVDGRIKSIERARE